MKGIRFGAPDNKQLTECRSVMSLWNKVEDSPGEPHGLDFQDGADIGGRRARGEAVSGVGYGVRAVGGDRVGARASP